MKLCWDNLEKIKYDKSNKKFYVRDGKEKKHKSYIEIVDSCKNCGKSFLKFVSNKGLFCCKECSENFMIKSNHPMWGKKHSKISLEKIGSAHRCKKLSEETRKKISKARKGWIFSKETKRKLKLNHADVKGNNNPNWKGGVKKKNIPLYDTYASQLDWCEKVRRSPTDRNVLEVKCTYCGKWFIPSLQNVSNRIQYLKDYKGCRGENRLYCSKPCKQACPIYNKQTVTLMKEDAVRAGRLQWLELNREVQSELRQIVIKRDNYTCQKCGTTDKPLHCHHIYPASTDPLMSADIDNCITLCEDCHKEAHQQDGCRYSDLKIEIC